MQTFLCGSLQNTTRHLPDLLSRNESREYDIFYNFQVLHRLIYKTAIRLADGRDRFHSEQIHHQRHTLLQWLPQLDCCSVHFYHFHKLGNRWHYYLLSHSSQTQKVTFSEGLLPLVFFSSLSQHCEKMGCSSTLME